MAKCRSFRSSSTNLGMHFARCDLLTGLDYMIALLPESSTTKEMCLGLGAKNWSSKV